LQTLITFGFGKIHAGTLVAYRESTRMMDRKESSGTPDSTSGDNFRKSAPEENGRGGTHVVMQFTAIDFLTKNEQNETDCFLSFAFEENIMKKFASIIGVSVLSIAVGLAPAFAQQTTKPMDNVGSSTTIQPKTDEKAPGANPAVKGEKSLPAKPGMDVKTDKALPAKTGTDVKSENIPAKSGTDVKASSKVAVSAKPGMDVKTDKALPAKTGTEVKSEDLPAKSTADVKTGSLPGKSEVAVKDDKASPVKPGANLKRDKTVGSRHAKHHHMKREEAAGKLESSKAALGKHHHVKTASAVSGNAKAEKINTVNPSTGN
jgi:hypothetical protein